MGSEMILDDVEKILNDWITVPGKDDDAKQAYVVTLDSGNGVPGTSC